MKTSHPGQVNQWAFWKLRAAIIIFGSVIMAQVMMVIDVDCSQSIRSLKRSILGFPSLARHISSSVKIRSWTATLQTSSETPPKSIVQLYYTTHCLNTSQRSIRKCKELSNLGWEVGKWWAKSGEMYCTFSRHGRAIQLKPASAQLGFIFNFVFPSIFCPSRPSTQTPQMPNWCKIQTTMELTKDLMALSARLYWLVSRDRLLNPNCLCKQIRVDKKMIFSWNALTRYL